VGGSDGCGSVAKNQQQKQQQINRISGLAALIVLVITYLMVAKPPLWGVSR